MKATQLFERWLFVKEHPGWTYADYDAAHAGDIALDAEFAKIYHAMLEKAKVDGAKHN